MASRQAKACPTCYSWGFVVVRGRCLLLRSDNSQTDIRHFTLRIGFQPDGRAGRGHTEIGRGQIGEARVGQFAGLFQV